MANNNNGGEKLDKVIIALVALLSTLALVAVLVVNAQAQTGNSQTFVKKFCSSEDGLLATERYTDGSEISYDASGCPESIITVHNWNSLSTATKNNIQNKLSSLGYASLSVNTQGGQGQ